MSRLSAMRRLLFTSSFDNFIQTAGIRDGASHCAKILSVFYDNLDTSDPNDPDVIIKIDVSNAFNTTDRALTLDMINGRASRDYAWGIKEGDVIGTVDSLTNLFGYFKAIAYADDGYIKGKLSIALQVLAELKDVFKADAGLKLNVSKTSILSKGVTAQAVFDMTQTIMQATSSLAHLRNDFLVASFYPEGFIGIGVPIVTDAFVQSFVA